MFEKMEKSSGNVIGIKVTGKLVDKDYDALNQWCDEIKKEHENIYMLCLFEDFHGWDELKAMWDDFKFGLDHRTDIKKCAIVGEKTWQEWAAKIANWMMKGDVKYFQHSDLEKAWDWVNNKE